MGLFVRLRLTILNPGITKCVDALRLMLANDDVLNGRSTHKVKDGVRVSSFGLLVAAAFDTLITLHLSIKDLTRIDVHGLVEHNSLLGDWKLDTRERETWWWSPTQICLSSISSTLRSITLLVLATTEGSSRRKCRYERNDESGSKPHCDR
jgi:hypothetical protein